MHGFSWHVNLNIVKNIAKITLFFCITFIIVFLTAMFFKYLSLRVDWVKILPQKAETAQSLMISAAHWALTLSLFTSILSAMNYIVRRKFNPFVSIICVMSLSFLFCFGISIVLSYWSSVPVTQSESMQFGGKGLILYDEMNRDENAVVLLNGTSDPLGPRVTVIPGQSMVYQYSSSGIAGLPPVPFGDDNPLFLKSFSADIRHNSGVFRQKFNEGIFSYLFYAGSLIFMLCSIGYFFKFSAWPLANLFIVILIFRGILALLAFVNSREIQAVIETYLNNRLPASLALPAFFLCFGLIINIYSLLTYAAKRRSYDDV